MITFDRVSKRFPDGTVAVDELSLEVPEGEVVVLVGPSGCGKTTTMRMINRMIEPTSGRLTVGGDDVMTVDPPTLRRRIGYVIQQVGLFPHRTAAENIATVPELLGWDKRRIAARVSELMELIGLPPEIADRYPHQLSGGQRQRVAIARALAQHPEVIILDEPLSALDVSVSAQIVNLLLQLQEELGVTYVFVGHDLRLVKHLCHDLAVMYHGRVVEQGDAQQVLTNPAHPYTAALVAASELTSLDLLAEDDDTTAPIEDVTVGCAYRNRCARAEARCATVVPERRHLGGDRAVRCHVPLHVGSAAPATDHAASV